MEDPVSSLLSLFSLSREAIIGVRKGVIVFMNPSAVKNMGGDYTGRPALAILPEHILNTAAEEFVSSASISGKSVSVSSSSLNGVRIYMLGFKPEEPFYSVGMSVISPFRTLLSNIKLSTDRLNAFAEANGDARLIQCSSVLSHSYHQIRRLLINIMAASALNQWDIPWLPVATEVRELCEGITEATAFFAKKQGISVDFECELPCCNAVVDRELIEQMLLNLLSNSLLHVDKGGRVRVSLKRSGLNLILSVDDNGSGMPPEVLSTVFCRWCEDMTLTESSSGAGFGLCAARNIAEKHGGALVIESKEGQGTAVRVMLPVDNEQHDIFRSSETPYNLDNMDPVLIQLSTWLPAAEYVQKLND